MNHQILFFVLYFIFGVTCSSLLFFFLIKKHLIKRRAEVNMLKSYYDIMREWVYLYQNNRVHFEKYFENNGYKQIAVCGIRDIGTLFYEEIKNSSIEIKYVIRIQDGERNIGIKVCDINDNLDAVDAIIVCEIGAFDYVKDVLESRVDCPIIALDDIVYEL